MQAVVARVIERGIIAREPEICDLGACKTENEDVILADGTEHFDIRAVKGAYCERAVEHELHAAGARRFLACQR